MLENWRIRKTLKHTNAAGFILRAPFDAAPSSYRTMARDPKSVGAAAGARGHEDGRGRAFVIFLLPKTRARVFRRLQVHSVT